MPKRSSESILALISCTPSVNSLLGSRSQRRITPGVRMLLSPVRYSTEVSSFHTSLPSMLQMLTSDAFTSGSANGSTTAENGCDNHIYLQGKTNDITHGNTINNRPINWPQNSLEAISRCPVRGQAVSGDFISAERIGHARRGGKLEFKFVRCPPSYEPACSVWVGIGESVEWPVGKRRVKHQVWIGSRGTGVERSQRHPRLAE